MVKQKEHIILIAWLKHQFIAQPLAHDAHRDQRQTDQSDNVSEDWYGSAQHKLVLEPSD